MIEGELLDAALAALLAKHPDAIVSAIDGDGLFVPLPDSVPVRGHRVSQARSALDLVVPEDRLKVIDCWSRARSEGGARTTVRVAGSTGARAVLHLSDVTGAHGVHMAVLVPFDGEGEQLEDAARVTAPAPRLIRARKDEMAVLMAVDDDVTAVLGWAPAEMVGARSIDFVHPDDHGTSIDAWMDVLAKPGATSRCRVRHRHRDGRWVWVEILNRNLLDRPGGGFVDSDMIDVSDEMEALEAVRASEHLFRRLAGALPVGVIQVDAERNLVYANDQLYRIFGAAPDVTERVLLACLVDREGFDGALGAVLAGADVDVELQVDPVDGSGRRRCTLAARALSSPEGEVTGAVLSISDITDAAKMRAELEWRASYDELTGCVNRPTAMAILTAALSTPGRQTAVVFVDLDRFKSVNDRFGHRAGDALLVVVADQLRGAVRAGDVVGRLGGDEFVVICPDVPEPAEGLALGERVAAAVTRPLLLDGVTHEASASVGVAWAAGVVDANVLIARADAAMYESKRAGGGRAVLADPPCVPPTPVRDGGAAQGASRTASPAATTPLAAASP